MSGEIFWLPETDGRKLAIVLRPQPRASLAAAEAWKAAGLDMIVSLLSVEEATALGLAGEAAACEAAGIRFVSYAIADFSVPDVVTLCELFDSLAGRLDAGTGVGIHCRGSVGRSGLVASCLLAYLGMEAETAMEVVSQARGLPVPETPAQREYVMAFPAAGRDERPG